MTPQRGVTEHRKALRAGLGKIWHQGIGKKKTTFCPGILAGIPSTSNSLLSCHRAQTRPNS